MSLAGSEFVPLLTLKTDVLFHTVPVGFAPSALLALGGMVMTSGLLKLGAGVPSWKYAVATPAPLSATNNVPDEETAIPHGFITLESVISATPGMSPSRFSQSKLARAVTASANMLAATSDTVLNGTRRVVSCVLSSVRVSFSC